MHKRSVSVHLSLKVLALLVLLLLSVSVLGAGEAQSTDRAVREIDDAIRAAGAEWTAGITSVAKLSAEEQGKLCGAILEDVPDEDKMRVPVKLEALTTHLDWRNKDGGDWTTPIRDQDGCGSCWDFSATGVFEALLNIQAGNPAFDMDLSEQHVLSCCSDCGNCATGGWAWRALEFCRTSGNVTETCQPYEADDTVACHDCPEVHQFIGDWTYIYENVESLKRAIYYYGPISAAFEVYSDFSYYTSGVYEHVSGYYRGGHAIVIVGWDDADQAWICKNSWGTNWGETIDGNPYTPGAGDGGWFRIRWGQCNIEGRATEMATLTSWPTGVVNVTVLDSAGHGVEGVDIYVNDDRYGTTDHDGVLALDLIDGMNYDIVACSSDAHLLLYGDVAAPGSLILDCRDASYVAVDAYKCDGSALHAWLNFAVGPNQRLYAPEYTSGGNGWFYVTPGFYNYYAWSYYDEVELYDLFFPNVDLTTSTSLTIDASTMPTSQFVLDTLVGFYEAFDLYGWTDERWWARGWWLDAGDSLVIEAGEWRRYGELIEASTTPYTWYYSGYQGFYSLVGGEEFHLEAGGDLALSSWPEEPEYMQGDAAYIWIELSDDYANTYNSVRRYDSSAASSTATSLPEVLARPDDEGERPVRLDAPGGTWGYFDPRLTITPPTEPTIFDDYAWLDWWVDVDLDLATELGTYAVRATQQTHQGELEALSSFDVLGPSPAVFRVTQEGSILADSAFYGTAFNSGSADVAEWVNVSEPVEAGDVLELDPENPGHYRKSRGPCSTLVAGVVSTEPGFVLGTNPSTLDLGSSTVDDGLWTGDSGFPTDDSRPATENSALLALVGIVPVKVTDEGGPIQPGDLLVCSSIPGYAMRWNLDKGTPCPLVGKALEAFSNGTGRILALLVR